MPQQCSPDNQSRPKGSIEHEDSSEHLEPKLDSYQDSDPYCEQEIDVFLAFEGGGAKGIAHLAALYEIEASTNKHLRQSSPYKYWPRYKIRGASGTSIGALFALLVALDFRANEILRLRALRLTIMKQCSIKSAVRMITRPRRFWARLQKHNRRFTISPALQDIGLDRNITKVFGSITLFGLIRLPAWSLIKALRQVFSSPATTIMAAATYLLVVLYLSNVLATMAMRGTSPDLIHQNWLGPVSMAAMLGGVFFVIGTITTALVLFRSVIRGLCSTESLALSLNSLLRDRIKLFDANSEGDIRRDDWYSGSNYGARGSSDKTEEKAFSPQKDQWVRFCDIARIRPLRVVSTNIRRQAMALWSDTNTPHIPVAKAVAASMALPPVFKPVELNGDLHCDGALTSNLPAWAFDGEQKYYPDCFTIAVEVDNGKDDKLKAKSSGFWQPLRDFHSLFQATAYGARELELRGSRSMVISVPSRNIGLLDFDMKGADVLANIGNHRIYIRRKIDDRVFWRQLNYQACMRIHSRVEQAFRGCETLEWRDGSSRIRIAVLVPHLPRGEGSRASQPRVLRTAYAYNFGARVHPRKGSSPARNSADPRKNWDVDDRIWLPIQGSVSGAAFSTKHPRWFVANVQDPQFHEDLSMNSSEHRYRNALHWDEREWIYSTPIYYGSRANPNSTVLRVITIDGNIPVPHRGDESTKDEKDKKQDKWWEKLSAEISSLKREMTEACEQEYEKIDYFQKEVYRPDNI